MKVLVSGNFCGNNKLVCNGMELEVDRIRRICRNFKIALESLLQLVFAGAILPLPDEACLKNNFKIILFNNSPVANYDKIPHPVCALPAPTKFAFAFLRASKELHQNQRMASFCWQTDASSHAWLEPVQMNTIV